MAVRFFFDIKSSIEFDILERLHVAATKTFKTGLINMTTSTYMKKLEECFSGRGRNRDKK